MSGLLLDSPLGPLWLTAEDGALTGCWLTPGGFCPRSPPSRPAGRTTRCWRRQGRG